MSVPNPRHHSSPVLRPEQLPLAVSPQRQIPIGQPMTGEDDGVEKILLAEDGSKQQEEFETDDVEAGHGRPVAAAFSAVSAPDKSSLKSSLKVEDKILRLNIGGSSYRIRTRSILKHGADTLLGRFVRMNEHHRRAWVDAYFEDEDEYFFERDLCFDKFMAELRFWAVSKAKMNDCCSPFAQYCLIKKSQHFDTPEKDHFIGLRCSKVRRRLWLILEGHSRSKWWKFFEITSTSCPICPLKEDRAVLAPFIRLMQKPRVTQFPQPQ
uniref:BTB_2 domain-containing protein n=1 Tax=Globodera pallida TaxID=36090 RepID=A0A183BV39_GLOPA